MRKKGLAMVRAATVFVISTMVWLLYFYAIDLLIIAKKLDPKQLKCGCGR